MQFDIKEISEIQFCKSVFIIKWHVKLNFNWKIYSNWIQFRFISKYGERREFI